MLSFHSTDTPIHFSSNNKAAFDHFCEILSTLTLDDIKHNNMVGRHKLMISLMCAGHCPLANEYFQVREIKAAKYEELMQQYIGTSTCTLEIPKTREIASQLTFEQTGWII